jgi:hypothetical protein
MANQQRGRWGPVASLLIVAALLGPALLAAPNRALAADTVLSNVTFREYYNLQADPYELVNLLADGVPSNDPDTAALSQTLRTTRQCVGAGCA